MTDRAHRADPIDPAPLPPDLVAERRRILRLAADAERRADRGRLCRRALLPAAVASGVLAATGLISVWARATSPAATTTASTTPSTAAQASAELAALNQLRQALNADKQAIAALPQAAASSLASGSAAASPSGGAAPAGAAPSAGAVTIPTLPPISVPSIPAAPPVHATTGASGLG